MRSRLATGSASFAVLAAFGLSGCGGDEGAKDTTCAEYLGMSVTEQRTVVAEVFADEEPPGSVSDVPYSQGALYAACLVDGESTLDDVLRVAE